MLLNSITGIVRGFCIFPSLFSPFSQTTILHRSLGAGYRLSSFLSLSNFFVVEDGVFGVGVGVGGAGGGRDGVMSKHSDHMQGLRSFNLEAQ